jgi:drug/metabolite transporter (DMT)-like permease
MCTAFGACCAGMIGGLFYGFYASFYQHRSLEDVLGHSIPYYRLLGGIGIVGFLLFLAFLVSAASHKKQDKPQ